MTVCPAQRAQRLGGGMGVGFRQFGEAVCRECAEAGGNERLAVIASYGDFLG